MVDTVIIVLCFSAIALITGLVVLGVSSVTQANKIDRLSMPDKEENND
tara:strand:+ start:153 stop:296 length:144 start_codon:yes stop_codon:yes gene_type:complete